LTTEKIIFDGFDLSGSKPLKRIELFSSHSKFSRLIRD